MWKIDEIWDFLFEKVYIKKKSASFSAYLFFQNTLNNVNNDFTYDLQNKTIWSSIYIHIYSLRTINRCISSAFVHKTWENMGKYWKYFFFNFHWKKIWKKLWISFFPKHYKSCRHWFNLWIGEKKILII